MLERCPLAFSILKRIGVDETFLLPDAVMPVLDAFSILKRIGVDETLMLKAQALALRMPFSILKRIGVDETLAANTDETWTITLSVSSNGSEWMKLLGGS